jgi:hypothetical protein
MERKKLLVTGCGRSGTLYASEVWKSQGLDVRHENPRPPNGRMGRDGIASWYMTVNDPDPPFGPSAADYEFDLVIHQVRHPLKVIPSVALVIFGDPASVRDPLSRQYIERNAPETRLSTEERSLPHRQQLLLQAARYWYCWNLLSQQKASLTVRVEHLTASLRGLCDLLGIAYRSEAADLISRSTHGRDLYTNEAHCQIGWEDINRIDPALCQKIKELALAYGY